MRARRYACLSRAPRSFLRPPLPSGWDLTSIVMMRTPTVKVTQNLDLMKTISREQLSDSRDMGFDCSPFWNQLKTKNCKLIIAKSVKYFYFLWTFFNALKDLSGYPISVQGTRGILESPILEISWGESPRTPLGVRASGTQRSRQRRERCTSANWTTASGTSKCYRKPCSEYKSISLQCQDPTSFPGRFSLAMQRKSTTGTRLGRIERILSNLLKNQPKAETL